MPTSNRFGQSWDCDALTSFNLAGGSYGVAAHCRQSVSVRSGLMEENHQQKKVKSECHWLLSHCKGPVGTAVINDDNLVVDVPVFGDSNVVSTKCQYTWHKKKTMIPRISTIDQVLFTKNERGKEWRSCYGDRNERHDTHSGQRMREPTKYLEEDEGGSSWGKEVDPAQPVRHNRSRHTTRQGNHHFRFECMSIVLSTGERRHSEDFCANCCRFA
jgi:hypothetical protein